MDFPIEKKQAKQPYSFTLSAEAHSLLTRYANIKDTSLSNVVDTLATHFLPKVLEQEESKRAAAK